MSRLRVLLEAFKGRVTLKEYPFKTLSAPEGFRGLPRVNADKCIGCGACTLICPSHALRLVEEDGVLVLKHFVSRCIFCTMCADVCPQQAIVVTKDYELAALEQSELEASIAHMMAECKECSRRFASEKTLEKVKEILGEQPYLYLCPDCRRKFFIAALTMGRR